MSSHATEHDGTTADQGDQGDPTGMTAEEKRHDQLTRAPKSDETDAAPRITTEERPDGVTRIDVADTAKVRPGGGEAHTRD